MSEIVVSYTFFYATHSEGFGGVLKIGSIVSLTIAHSVFSTISSTSYGGAVYSTSQTCSLSFSSFFSCYSSQSTSRDNIYGNAVFHNGTNSHISHNEFHKCGPDSKTGDSSISCISVVSCEYQNATHNHGIGGSSGMSCRATSSENFVKYLNVVNAYDYTAIECCSKLLVTFSNFLNTSNLVWAVIYQAGINMMEFDTCVFINSPDKFSYNNRPCKFTNCRSDKTFESMTSTNNVETLDIQITIIHKLFPEKTHNFWIMRKHNFFLFFILINLKH